MIRQAAIYLAVAALARPAGGARPQASKAGAPHGGRSGAGDRQEYRLGEGMYRFGMLLGERHAREGLDLSQEMSKNPSFVPGYAFGGFFLRPNAMSTAPLKRMAAMSHDLAKRIFAAPPHLRSTYYNAFVAGYELGHELNLPKERLTGLLSLDHLVRIRSALGSYVVEGDRKIPPMTSIASLRRALVPLMGVRATDFVNPYTSQPYGINSSLSGKDLGDLESHAPHTVFAFEATPAPDGTRGVLFVSGEVVRVPEREWEQLRNASGIE